MLEDLHKCSAYQIPPQQSNICFRNMQYPSVLRRDAEGLHTRNRKFKYGCSDLRCTTTLLTVAFWAAVVGPPNLCEKSPIANCLGSSLPERMLSRLTPIRLPPYRRAVRISHGA